MTSQERYSGSRISGQSAYSSGTGFGQTGLSESFSGLNVRNVQASGATQPANFEAKRQELEGETEALLRYASELNKNVVVSGSTDYSKISTLKNALLELRNAYFSQSSGLSIQGENRDELDRRFLLVEHELDGLLRRRIEYSSKDYESGTRTLDFTNLLNEKENQIVELQKKIQNLEQRLRRATAREIELEGKITTLKAENFTLRDKSYTGEKLEDAMRREAQYEQAQKDLNTLQANFATAAGLWNEQLGRIARKYPNDRFDLDGQITSLLQRSNVKSSTVNGISTVEVFSERTVEVPVQDSRTKHLIHLLATNMKRLAGKYPKLLQELDEKLVQFFQQELIDVIEVDELDRVVQIVRFVPQAVRVENVYAYSSAKSRRVQFHLRVLIKALLESIAKVQAKTGAVMDIDQGVMGLINQEIMGVVNVDDILKVFRVVPKIVEVQKIVEKIVERIVEVPTIVPLDRYIEKVVQVPRMVEIEKIVHVPIEIIKYVDKIVEKIVEVPTFSEKIVQVPTVVEKVVQRIVEKPKIVEVQKIVEKVVVNTQVVTVDIPVNHISVQPKQVIVYRDKVIPVQKVIEKILQVPTYIDRIIERTIEVPRVVEVEKMVQKIVKVIEYQVVDQNKVAVQERIKEVQKIVEKVVVIEKIVEKIVEVPRVIDRPVPLRVEKVEIKEVEVVREKLVPVIQIKEIEKVNNVMVPLVKQVEKVVDRMVQVPIIVQKIVKVPQIITKVVIERIHVPQVIPVERIVEKIVYETQILEVEKPVIHYIKDIQVVKQQVEKIVQVPRTVERIKEVKVRVQKIVQKMVEVPKVVEVEKILEKIVVVPRVVEKIVEVPQIIEVIVEKIVENTIVKQVPTTVDRIVQVQKIVQVEKVKNVYVNVQKVVQRIVEKIVPVEKIVERNNVVQQVVEKVVSINVEVPKEIIVEKVVTKIVEREVYVEVKTPCTVIVEVPIEVERVVEKAVKVVEYSEKLVNAIEFVEKVVQVQVEVPKVMEVEKIRDKIVPIEKLNVIKEDRVIVQERIKEVPTVVEKIVPVKETIRQEVPVQQIVEKIVERVIEVPRIVTVETLVEKMVEKTEVIELEKIVPQVVRVNEVVREIVQKIIAVNYREEVIKQVPTAYEKIVQVQSNNTNVQSVQVFKDKIVEINKFKEFTNTKNHIEKEIQVVDRFEKTSVPVYTTVERIVEVPQIIEKIVERIVVMPQVVEVLKYVHEIVETEDLGVSLSADLQVTEARYRQLYGLTKKQIEVLLVQLRRLRTAQPELVGYITLIEKFLVEFDRFAATQRVVTVPRDVIVEKQVTKSVLVPTHDSVTIRKELSLSLLVEKLILEIKRIKKDNPNVNLNLDQEVRLVFFSELFDKQSNKLDGEFTQQLKDYTQSALSKFNKLGGSWTFDHELMLNSVLQQRFAMANLVKQANLEIQKVRIISDKRAQALKQKQTQFLQASKTLNNTFQSLNDLVNNNPTLQNNTTITRIFTSLNSFITSSFAITLDQPIKILGDFVGSGNDFNRVSSVLRERDATIDLLKQRIYDIEKRYVQHEYSGVDNDRTIDSLRKDNIELSMEIDRLKSQLSTAGSGSSTQVRELEIKLKTAESKIQELQSQLRSAEIQLSQLKDSKSSAASSVIQTPSNTNLNSSQYSSSSSTNKFGNIAQSGVYESPSYAQDTSLTGSGIRPSLTGQGYGTSYGQPQPIGTELGTGVTSSNLYTSGKIVSGGIGGTTGTYSGSLSGYTAGTGAAYNTGSSSGYTPNTAGYTSTAGTTGYGSGTTGYTSTTQGYTATATAGYTSATTAGYGLSGSNVGGSGSGTTTGGYAGYTSTYGNVAGTTSGGMTSSGTGYSSLSASGRGSVTGATGGLSGSISGGLSGSGVSGSLSGSGVGTSGYTFQTKKY